MPNKVKKTAIKHAVASDSVISVLEKNRESRVIVYITGDRQGAPGAMVAIDTLPLFKRILFKMGETKKITLVLYTNGGFIEAPWPIVNLIREYCDEFEVIVLEKALSAGTLIALGADQIIMSKHAFLSPVDPAASITLQNNETKRFEIEDIVGFVDFIKEKVGITEQQALCGLVKDLTAEISPTMLGSANRTHSLIRRLAKKLLGLHRKPVPERQAREIIEHLTEKLFSHKHLISRREACEIGFEQIIEFPDSKFEKVLEDLRKHFFALMELDHPFDPGLALSNAKTAATTIEFITAVVHSADVKFDFKARTTLEKGINTAGVAELKMVAQQNIWTERK